MDVHPSHKRVEENIMKRPSLRYTEDAPQSIGHNIEKAVKNKR